jgi:hypothetical protein
VGDIAGALAFGGATGGSGPFTFGMPRSASSDHTLGGAGWYRDGVRALVTVGSWSARVGALGAVGLALASCRGGEVVRAPVAPAGDRREARPLAAPPSPRRGSAEPAPVSPGGCEPEMFMDHAAGASGLSTFEAPNGLIGYRDAAGKVVISPRFRHAYEFPPEGVTGAVNAQGQTVFIDRTGAVVAQALTYDNGPDYFQGGFARIVKNGKVGFIDRRGRLAVPPSWDGAYPFCEGRAVVCHGCVRGTADEHDVWAGGRWGFVDTRARVVIPLRYDEAGSFDAGEAEVRDGARWLRIDRDGHVLGARH